MKNLYTALANATGGRRGMVRTKDSHLTFKLTHYEDIKPDMGTNPEELFACGYAACFGNTVESMARQQGFDILPIVVNAAVDLMEEGGQYNLHITLDVLLPSLPQETAEKIVRLAHQSCPYSKALRGDVKVAIQTNQQIVPAADFVPAQSFAAK